MRRPIEPISATRWASRASTPGRGGLFSSCPRRIAVHPTDGEAAHEFYLMCDDIEAVLEQLTAGGTIVSRPISDQGWGRLASIRLPSGADLPIYEPRHQVAYDLPH